jgi:hypothetical protein
MAEAPQGSAGNKLVADVLASTVREEAGRDVSRPAPTSLKGITKTEDGPSAQDAATTPPSLGEKTKENEGTATEPSGETSEELSNKTTANPIAGEGLAGEGKKNTTFVPTNEEAAAETAVVPRDLDQLLNHGVEALLMKHTSEAGKPELAKQIELIRLAVIAKGKYAVIIKKDALNILQEHKVAEIEPYLKEMKDDLQQADASLEVELIGKLLKPEEIVRIKANVGKDGIRALIQLEKQGKLDDLGVNVFGQELSSQQMEIIAGRIGVKKEANIDWKKKGKQGILLLLAFILGVGGEEIRDNASIDGLMGTGPR